MADAILEDIESSGVYQILNLVNGKRYIGSAKCFRIRWNGHRAKLERGAHHSKHLQASWRKHGAESFEFQILEGCDPEDLLKREQAWMDKLAPEYNICPTAGNTLGRRHSRETRLKISRRHTGRKMPPRSEEHRRKLSEAHAGKKKPEHVIRALQEGRRRRVYTDECKRRLSIAVRKGYADGSRSRDKTEEQKNNIGRFFAKLSDNEVREIRKLRASGVTGRELAKRFDSNPGTISEICSGKRYRWVR